MEYGAAKIFRAKVVWAESSAVSLHREPLDYITCQVRNKVDPLKSYTVTD